MLKPLLALLALLALVALPLSACAQSTPTFRSFDTNDFSITLGAPPTTIAKIHALRTGVTNIFNNTLIINTNVTEEFFSTTNFFDNSVITITNSFLTITNTVVNINGNTNIGIDLWTNRFDNLEPVDQTVEVQVPHLLSLGRIDVQQLAWGLGAGTNFINVTNHSALYFYTGGTNPPDTIVNLSDGFETIQYLDIFSYTNLDAFALGQWTLPAGSALPGGGIVKLLGDRDWIGGNGRGISLRWVQPNWVEIGRWDVIAGTVGLGESLWTNNAGVLQPIALTNQPMVDRGWFIGTNAQAFWGQPLGGLGGSLVAWRSPSNGDTNYQEAFVGVGTDLDNGAYADIFGNTDAFSLFLYTATNGLTSGLGLSSGLGSSSIAFSISGTNVGNLAPDAPDGTTPWFLGTKLPHTTGNLLEVANAGGKQLSLGVNGALALGPSSYSVTAFDDPTERLIFSLADTTKGESDYWQFRMGATSHTNDIEKGSAYSWLSGSTNALLWINQLKDPTGTIKQYISFGLNPESHGGFLSSGFGMGSTNREVTTLNPYSVAATIGPVVTYLLDTEVTQTNKSLKLLSVQNNQNERFGVTQAGSIIVPVAHTPASSSETNYVGAITWDSTNIYVWTATNVNKRAALSTW